MALTNVNLTEDSTGWYIYAWWFVSHELPTAVISIIRLTILLKIDLNSPDLDYNYVDLSSWSIGESNMAIVAGAILISFLQKLELNVVTACLPSLRPILSLILYGEPRPSARGARGKMFSRSWPRSQPSAVVQPHEQSKSMSESRQDFIIPLPHEPCDFTSIDALFGTTVRAPGDRKVRDEEDLEMQTGSPRAKSGIKVQSDVTVQSTPNQ
ncbi:MAG: hypothetical protein Q9175_006820 [Cornicularia normoerica]